MFQTSTTGTSLSNIASGNSSTVSININTISGYTPIGIVGVGISSTGSSAMVVYSFELTSTTRLRYKYHNYGTGSASPNIDFTILYVKSSLV